MKILKRKLDDGDPLYMHSHRVPLDLNDDDHRRLIELVKYTKTTKADVLRQCLNHVYLKQFDK